MRTGTAGYGFWSEPERKCRVGPERRLHTLDTWDLEISPSQRGPHSSPRVINNSTLSARLTTSPPIGLISNVLQALIVGNKQWEPVLALTLHSCQDPRRFGLDHMFGALDLS